MKFDVVIPTKDPSRVRPALVKVLESDPMVNNIIYETSKPLSTARKIGAMACSTEWIAMFDDDVEIPPWWFQMVSKPTRATDVVAISTVFHDDNIHLFSYEQIANKIKPLHERDTPFICNLLIRRSVFDDYNPPRLFYGEDELLYRHAKKKGRWLHLPYIGVKHFYTKKNIVQAGATMERLGFYPRYRFLRGIASRFALPIPALAYSRTISTVKFFWQLNVEQIAGALKGVLAK